MFRALRRVCRNKGAPGADGMTVEELPGYLRTHWLEIRAALLNGSYRPQPVLRKEIPKAGGGVRELGIPTVLDRLIQQALAQVLQAEWDRSFSSFSFGFRPRRSAHQAIACAQQFLREGFNWVVDLDLERFFDRVVHESLMTRVKRRIAEPRVLKLIDRYLKSGVMIGEMLEPTEEGVPQGGPLSPLLANLLLDDLDRELEKRGHRFVRYADDVNIYVRSQRAGERVLASVTKFLEKRLKLRVNVEKSAVDRPWRRVLLGFTFVGREYRRRVSDKALKALRGTVKQKTRRTLGVSFRSLMSGLGKTLRGWWSYYGFNEVPSPLQEVEKWIRRRLRCYLWKQWGRRGYRELKRRGVSVDLAWNTAKSAHGPWRLSQSPGLTIALPAKYFRRLGLPKLVNG
ncbi:MAG TPA: group II intron reverse transcriptase/maturase [Thermoanaerobaculia bacterium]|nr:group II intron reverse transcriptase/maturase [Thermoanaerobaculia bacterium]